MAAADDQRAGDEQAEERSAGEHRLSLAEWLVLCLVREEPTYGLVLVGLLDLFNIPREHRAGGRELTALLLPLMEWIVANAPGILNPA
jgi:hypothetical protein